MFNKNNDTWLKITNMVLIIIATVALGIAIANNYYYENYEGSDVEWQNIALTVNTGYCLFGTAVASLIICNVMKKK